MMFFKFKRNFGTNFKNNLLVRETGKTAVFIIAGDSQTGYSLLPSPFSDDKVFSWKDSIAKNIRAKDPLEHISYPTARIGCMVFFAKKYSAMTGHNVLIIPAGQGGSGFQNAAWKSGGSLYVEAVQRFNDGYAAAIKPFFAGMILSIGANNTGTVDYQYQLENLITRFRADLSGGSSTVPAVLYNLNPDYIITYGRSGINEIAKDLPRTAAYTAVVDMTGIRSNNGVTANGDLTHHYDTDIIASRIISELNNAKLNVTPIGTNLKPQLFLTPTVSQSAGVLTISITYSAWYNPQPTSQRIDIYKSDDAAGTNETLVSTLTTTIITTSRAYTLPAPDGKYYYGKFRGVNAIGFNDFVTGTKYQHI